MCRTNPSDWKVVGYDTRSAIQGTPSPSNVHRTFSVRLNRFLATRARVFHLTMHADLRCILERGTKPLHTKNPSRLLLKGSESGGYLSRTLSSYMYQNHVLVVSTRMCCALPIANSLQLRFTLGAPLIKESR